jgi:hypothetical protein
MSGKAVLALVVAIAAAALAPVAATAATWTRVTSGKQGNSNVLGVARTGDGVLHVAWNVDDSGTAQSIHVTPISPAGKVGAAADVVSGWAGAGSPALVARPNGGLRIFFGGIHSTSAGDPLVGMILAASDPSGTAWNGDENIDARTDDYGYGRVPGATLASGGTSLVTWYDVDQTVVLELNPDAFHRFVDASGGACCAILQNIATDSSSGAVVAGWCQFDHAPNGIWLQPVNAGTGAPGGPPVRMPGTVTTFNGTEIHSCEVTQRTPLAARSGGGIFTASTAGYPSTSSVLVWRFGASSSVTVGAAKGESLKVPQLAAAPDGRLWVGWLDSKGDVHLRRSNRAVTVWGAEVVVAPPKGTVSAFALDLSAQASNVDVLARFQSLSDLQVFHTQAEPGLSLSASPTSLSRKGATVTFRVTDAGDPVKGAKVKFAGASATTSAKGVAKLAAGPFRRAGKSSAKATKDGYVAGKAKLRVR